MYYSFIMERICKNCNKIYKSYKSLWNHNKKYHQEIKNKNPDSNDKYNCRVCNKEFSKYQNRWRHEKSCNKDVSNEELAEKLFKLEKELEKFKSRPQAPKTVINNINQGVINKGSLYNFLNKTGNENLNILSQKEIEYIMEQQFNCVVSMIELLNFNQEIPENHTFCTTALNNKYISTINPETLEVGKQRKKDFYDSLLWSGINNMKILYDKYTLKNTKKAVIYKKNIDSLVDYLIVNDKGKKTFVELINALTFNKRHIVQATWSSLKNNQLPEIKRLMEDSEESDSELEVDTKTKPKMEGTTYKPLDLARSDSDSDDSLDFDNSIKILYRNIQYILDENQLFHINNDGTRGKLFGSYSNGKVIKNKEIEV